MLTLAIAERTYSSWSLRGHLLMEIVQAPYAVRHVNLRTPDFDALAAEFAPARSVPMLEIDDPEGESIRLWDSLAIAETLHERFPDAGIWPRDAAARAAARSVTAEMHSGFAALRRLCPMNLERVYEGFRAPEADAEALEADVDRVETLWGWARGRWGAGGPWLFGADFTAADAFYAPVATRLVTYGLLRSDLARGYAAAIYARPAFRRWRAMGVAEGRVVDRYEMDLPRAARFGPAPLPARAVEGGTPVNAACPYSGRPVAADSLAEIAGRVVGFCNPFCRDKSVADAEAWPKLLPLLA
jgi:glutathione S-transferase